MKLRTFLIAVIIVFATEVVGLAVFFSRTPELKQDTVAVNHIVKSVEMNWADLNNSEMPNLLDYAVLNLEGSCIFKTKDGVSENINSAIAHRDTVLDVVVQGNIVGKVLIYNDSAALFARQQNRALIVFIVALSLQALLCGFYFFYLSKIIIRPFSKLKGFATRIAGGNLDVPLNMDRNNLFGAFTESFDIMRSELKSAKKAEAAANESKKELVAKLSHDIKTPVASIKAAAELGRVSSKSEKDRVSFDRIVIKTDQINALVTNLFSATLEELQQLSVVPADLESGEILQMLKNSDYLSRAVIPQIPSCLLSFDKLRLQQVFDNVIVNSYKYADTEIKISCATENSYLIIKIEDFGGGVSDDELPILTEKYKRGENAIGKEGAGLGLYLSRHFMSAMGGELKAENTLKGFAVILSICLSGK